MIPVKLQPEPNDFKTRIAAPGRKFLRRFPSPTQAQWRTHSYWRRCLSELHEAYDGICAYSCHWIPYDTGSATVEHFRPKSIYPLLAYKWDNYRLVCGPLNGRKGDDDTLLDPFLLRAGWFVLEFPSLLVKPAEGLTRAQKKAVIHTRDALGLNDNGSCWKARDGYLRNYCLDHISFTFLQHDAPFIAEELRRQGLVNKIRSMMGYR